MFANPANSPWIANSPVFPNRDSPPHRPTFVLRKSCRIFKDPTDRRPKTDQIAAGTRSFHPEIARKRTSPVWWPMEQDAGIAFGEVSADHFPGYQGPSVCRTPANRLPECRCSEPYRASFAQSIESKKVRCVLLVRQIVLQFGNEVRLPIGSVSFLANVRSAYALSPRGFLRQTIVCSAKPR